MEAIKSANICPKLCSECPFSTNSMRGWLADYTVQDIQDYVTHEGLFPCHKTVKGESLDQTEVQEALAEGKSVLCRGFVESMIKSGKMPKYSAVLKEAIRKVKEQGLNGDSMSMFDFAKHHTIKR